MPNGDPRDGFFYPTLTPHDRFLYSTASQFEDEDDLVNNCLCKLQDGLKVKPGEATEALRQYGRFRAEMDRLQQRLERPSVGTFSV